MWWDVVGEEVESGRRGKVIGWLSEIGVLEQLGGVRGKSSISDRTLIRFHCGADSGMSLPNLPVSSRI